MRRLEYPVLGLPVQFESDSDDVIEIVEDAFGGWSCLDEAEWNAHTPLVVRFMLSGTDDRPAERDTHAAVRHFCPDADRLIASSPGCFGVSDPSRGEAVAVVTPALVRDREHFRETFLEALTFALLSAFDRHPIHAAAIAGDARVVLLAGPSGAGKSSLASVAHAAGLAILGDDHVWIQTSPRFRVWGSPRHIRLASAEPTNDPRGKAVIRLDAGPRDASWYHADSATVCLLERGENAALERVNGHAIVDALTQRVDPGFDRFPRRHLNVVRALSDGGGWKLTLSENPNDALPLLRAMLDQR